MYQFFALFLRLIESRKNRPIGEILLYEFQLGLNAAKVTQNLPKGEHSESSAEKIASRNLNPATLKWGITVAPADLQP